MPHEFWGSNFKPMRTDTVPALLWAADPVTANFGGRIFPWRQILFSHAYIDCYSAEHSRWPSTDIQSSFCVFLSSLSLSYELYHPWSHGLLKLNIISSTHGVHCSPPHMNHCSLFCDIQCLPNYYFIYFVHLWLYRWKGKSSSYSSVFAGSRNVLSI